MKLIVAGSRYLTFDFDQFDSFLLEHHLDPGLITEIISGRAKGVDRLGEKFAKIYGIPVQPFPADWQDLTHKDAVIRTGANGIQYDARAGFRRNNKMAEYADALLLIWDGRSGGSANMKKQMQRLNKPIYEIILKLPHN